MLKSPRAWFCFGCVAFFLSILPYGAKGGESGGALVRNEAGAVVSPRNTSLKAQSACPAKAMPQRKLASRTIGVDAIHGRYYNSDIYYSQRNVQMRTEMTKMGFDILPLTSFGKDDLAGLCAVIVRQHSELTADNDFKTTEITALHNFVAAGGGLLAIAEGGYSSDKWTSTMDSLLAPYGIGLSSSATDGNGYTITNFIDHPLTRGVTSFGVDFQRCLTQIQPPAMDLTPASGADDALACVDAHDGSGNVVVLSDISCFGDHSGASGVDRDITFGDNLRLLRNIVNYITGSFVGYNSISYQHSQAYE